MLCIFSGRTMMLNNAFISKLENLFFLHQEEITTKQCCLVNTISFSLFQTDSLAYFIQCLLIYIIKFIIKSTF